MAHPRQFFDHYAYFLVALLVLPVGLGVAALVDALPRGRRVSWPSVAVVGALAVVTAWLVPAAAGRAHDYTAGRCRLPRSDPQLRTERLVRGDRPADGAAPG